MTYATNSDWIGDVQDDDIDRLMDALNPEERREWPWDWRFWARPAQLAPQGNWRIWLVMAGRGFGKTRCGAEWVNAIAEDSPQARVALVASNLGEARSVMVEGESGLLSVGAPWRRPRFEPSLRRLTWPNGAQAMLYSAGEPESLRGPQHSHAWCDEIAKWDNASERAIAAWDNLQMGLRLGTDPRIVGTTTPRSVPLLMQLLKQSAHDVAVTKGSTFDNAANLPPQFLETMRQTYGQSTLGRQELDGEIIQDIDGALWSRSLFERCRKEPTGRHVYSRVVIGVDPPASATGDACGIIATALCEDGSAHVLADASIEKAGPERWARVVADTAQAWGADRVVAEANQGGAMVGAVLKAAQLTLPLKLVHASRGKVARAEPIAALYQAGRVAHLGTFPMLEDELCGLMTGGTYQGPGRSPDRADALVWALSELMLGNTGHPRVRMA